MIQTSSLLKDDIALFRLVRRAVQVRCRRSPLHEARQRPDVRLSHLQRLVLGQFVVWKVCKEMHQYAHVQCNCRRVGPLNRQFLLIYQSKRKDMCMCGGLHVAGSHENS